MELVNNKPLITPLGIKQLPKGWRWSRLDDLCDGVFDNLHSTPTLVNEGPFYVVRTQDILTGIFRRDNAGRVTEQTYRERIARAEPSYGDLVYSREGTYFGIAAEVPLNVKVCLGQRMMLIKPKPDKVYFRYLRYWLNSPIMSSHVYGFRDGTVAERLNLPVVRGLPVLLPPPTEQRTIAHILGALDDKIELNRKMNETLEAMARAIFTSWFVDFDPVLAKAEGRQPAGMDAETAALFPNSFEDTALGEVPRGWKVTELGDITEVIDCLHSKKPERQPEGKPFLQLSNIRDDGLLDITDMYFISPKDYNLWISRIEASPGDCVITNVGRVGAVSQIPDGQKAALGRNMTAIRCKRDHEFPTYLIEYLLSDFGKREMNLKTDTGTILNALNVRNIPKLRLIKAPSQILQRFELVARPFRAKMESNLRESRTLATLRDTLLPKLMSGEVRVKQAEAKVERVERAPRKEKVHPYRRHLRPNDIYRRR